MNPLLPLLALAAAILGILAVFAVVLLAPAVRGLAGEEDADDGMLDIVLFGRPVASRRSGGLPPPRPETERPLPSYRSRPIAAAPAMPVPAAALRLAVEPPAVVPRRVAPPAEVTTGRRSTPPSEGRGRKSAPPTPRSRPVEPSPAPAARPTPHLPEVELRGAPVDPWEARSRRTPVADVLVITADESLSRSQLGVLASGGCSSRRATCASEALSAMRSRIPDLLLVEAAGAAEAKRIVTAVRSGPGAERVPVVLLTAVDDGRAMRRRAVELDVTDVVVDPLSMPRQVERALPYGLAGVSVFTPTRR